MNIHESRERNLVPADQERIDAAAETQEEIILAILQGRPDYRFGYFEIIELTGYDKDSAKRSLSNLSGSHPEKKYIDVNGEWPVKYDGVNRKINPNTRASVGTYYYNPEYGKPLKPGSVTQGALCGDTPAVKTGPYSGRGA